MPEITQFEKITNVWQTPAPRQVDKSGKREQPKQKQQESGQQQKQDNKDDGPGTTIDEYA